MQKNIFFTSYHIIIILLYIFGVVLFFLHNAVALENSVFTLSESIKIATEKSLAIDSADKTVQGAESEKKKAFKSFLPTLGAAYTYTKLNEAPTASTYAFRNVNISGNIIPIINGSRIIDVGSKDNYQAKMTLTQPIFAGLKIFTGYELAKLGLDVAKISKAQAELDFVLQVKEVYFDILQAQKSAEVARQAVKQMSEHLNVAKRFYAVGMTTKNQVLVAEVKLSESLQTKTISENAVIMAKAAFNTLLRRPVDAFVEVEDVLIYKPFYYDVKHCLDKAFSNRPEIMAAEKNEKIAEKNVRLARGDYYPAVGLNANHYWEGDTWNVNGSDYLDNNTSWDCSVTFTWAFEWGKSLNSTNKSKAELKKAQNTLTQIKDRIRLEIKNIYLSMKVEEKNISVAEKTIEQAEENFRINQERYNSQVGTSTEVTDATTLLTAAKHNYYDALYSYSLAWANIERAMGKR